MIYGELIKVLSEKTGQTQTIVKAILNAFKEITIDEMVADGDIRLPGLGIFKAFHAKKRKGYNMHTKEMCEIPAMTRPKFEFSVNVKERLKEK